MSAPSTLRILTVSPHPDDEALGAPMTLQTLAAAGHHVLNAACSLGRPDDHDRRRAELVAACTRAGYDLTVSDPPAAISAGDDLAASQRQLTGWVRRLVTDHDPHIVVSPHPHDLHHGHEVVARAVHDALTDASADAGWSGRWWQWAIWGDLAFPSLYVPCTQGQLDRALEVLEAYAGENDRNDYRQLLTGRAILNTTLGSEKVFGFGAARASEQPYAEVLLEAVRDGHRWHRTAPRVLDLTDPCPPVQVSESLEAFLRTPSPLRLLGTTRP